MYCNRTWKYSMSVQRTVRVVTDAAAPGLMIYGLHRDLSSDTDDTDYEPGEDDIKKSRSGMVGLLKWLYI